MNTYIRKYEYRFNYRITNERVFVILQYLKNISFEKDSFSVLVSNEDVNDFKFLVMVMKHFCIISTQKTNLGTELGLIRVNENAQFKVIKEITPENHFWVNKIIPVGTILVGSSEYDYGTVDWLNGIGVAQDGGITQINKEFINFNTNNLLYELL
ncbi:hypothetical protein ACV07N_15665 [Roseivirga echinicomitans]